MWPAGRSADCGPREPALRTSPWSDPGCCGRRADLSFDGLLDGLSEGEGQASVDRATDAVIEACAVQPWNGNRPLTPCLLRERRRSHLALARNAGQHLAQ
ncbi:hypothetical protein GCM10010211_73780 [Streptomyces albospinus]|uniref:Uncharacterized protein n=1 Tax=Streptomyces albospinus TaxID=285515 RepID=A0ABQ2VL91_9ACTN|nr:hypothetical protein GCM10010211_73780 [Streptomyces albospinus]